MKINFCLSSHSVIAIVALARAWLPLWAFSYIPPITLECKILKPPRPVQSMVCWVTVEGIAVIGNLQRLSKGI